MYRSQPAKARLTALRSPADPTGAQSLLLQEGNRGTLLHRRRLGCRAREWEWQGSRWDVWSCDGMWWRRIYEALIETPWMKARKGTTGKRVMTAIRLKGWREFAVQGSDDCLVRHVRKPQGSSSSETSLTGAGNNAQHQMDRLPRFRRGIQVAVDRISAKIADAPRRISTPPPTMLHPSTS